MFFEILQSYTGLNITELRGLDATLLSTSNRNNRVVAQLLDNSDDEMDTIDKDSDGIEESEEEGNGNQEEETALELVAALLSAQADITGACLISVPVPRNPPKDVFGLNHFV